MPESKYPFFRFGNYTKVAPNKNRPEIFNLYIEFSGGKEFSVIPPLNDILSNLKEMKVLDKNAEIIESLVLPVKYAYIVYDKHRDDAVKTVQEYLIANGVSSVGRFGNWEYSSMEDAIILGKNTADLLNSTEIL